MRNFLHFPKGWLHFGKRMVFYTLSFLYFPGGITQGKL